MKFFVTGANGFLGQAVVACALGRGHQVRALLRPVSRDPWPDPKPVDLSVHRGDLRAPPDLSAQLSDTDAVIHLAAAKKGELYAQLADSVVATENLLAAMDAAGCRQMVLISSFSVYEYQRRAAGSRIDGEAPLLADMNDRDAYACSKFLQERVARKWAEARGAGLTVLRPGVVYGRENLWTARLGRQIGRNWWVRIGARAPVPLTYVENCAEAIVLCAQSPEARGQSFAIVDDDPPTQRQYAAEVQALTQPRPRVIPLPWWLVRGLADVGSLANRWLLKDRAKLPVLLRPAVLHALHKPMRYDNSRLKQLVGWRPRFERAEALRRCINQPH